MPQTAHISRSTAAACNVRHIGQFDASWFSNNPNEDGTPGASSKKVYRDKVRWSSSHYRYFLVAPLLLALVGPLLAMCSVSRAEPVSQFPAVVPLIKQQYPGEPKNIDLLHINIVALGKIQINRPVLFDTGSSGIVVDCAIVLPIKYCAVDSIKIKAPLELDGLKVTTETYVAHFGTHDSYGNIAYAVVAFGNPNSSVTTKSEIPILIRYKQVVRASGEVVGGPLWPLGIFGVSPIEGSKLVSPMKFVDVGRDLKRGFYLSPIGRRWQICTNEEKTCPESLALHVGFDAATESTFILSKIHQQNPTDGFPTVETCIKTEQQQSCGPTLFDTGNSDIAIIENEKTDSPTYLGVGQRVAISGATFGNWEFVTMHEHEVQYAKYSHAAPGNLVGIKYFEENSLLFDLDENQIGFRIGK